MKRLGANVLTNKEIMDLVNRRFDDFRSGKTQGLTHDEVMASIKDLL